MAQHDYVIANGTGAAVRSDLNNALAAIVSQNSGATEPVTMYAYQWWADTTTGLLKLRNGANNAWITLRELDGTLTIEDGTAGAPGLAFADDLNTGVFSPGADQVAFTAGGTARLTATTTGITSALPVDVPLGSASAPTVTFTGDLNTGIYSPGADQVAVATNGTGRLFVNSSGSVGIGTSSPSTRLHLNSADASANYLRVENTGGYALFGVDGSGNTYAGAESNDAFGLVTNGSYRMYITAGGNVGIGTTTVDDILHLKKAGDLYLRVENSSTNVIAYFGQNSSGTYIGNGATGSDIRFLPAGTERCRLTTSGQLLVGTSTSVGGEMVQFHNTTGNNLAVGRFVNSSGSPDIAFYKSRSGTIGTNAVVTNGDNLGVLSWRGADGTNYLESATISTWVDGTPGTNDMPGRLVFSTTADGASSPTERLRITSTGAVFFKKTVNDYTTEGAIINQGASPGVDTSFVTAGGPAATFARSTNDGTIISLRQDGTEEGTISVSGSTVSYNGAHLSRWSQLPSGAEREEILRGTVLSNLDEMCEWGEEENEQLNRMKVSDVEGDKNVSGVFQAWDDDDDTYTNDFYCAMTGDFIIRIAADTTVERGDLLMSAGDGTAKPQDDDIIRSKTIAKVTSTNVSCTYEDGSYCVPCVLMAC